MDFTRFGSGGGTEAAHPFRLQRAYPVSCPANSDSPSSRGLCLQYPELQNSQGTSLAPLPQSSRASLENPDLQCPPAISPAPPRERALTNPDPQSSRSLLQGDPSASPSLLHTELQSNRGLAHMSSCGQQASKCSSISHQNRNHANSFSASPQQQSAHFNVEQQFAHLNSRNVEHRSNIDNFSADFAQTMYSNDFSASIEQRNHANNFCANPEQSTHVNSSASSCCQPLKHHSRHGEPLYKSLLRPHHCSHSPLMDYAEGPHHLQHHECTFEAENSAVSNRLSHQFTDCSTCRFGFSNLDENNTSRGSVSKGQNYFSFRALSNEITLYNWYLIRSNGSHSSEIAVGGFSSDRGMDNERIETSTIVKRLEEHKVLTKDGNVVNLVGPIDDYRTVSNGFSLQTVHLFISGFPHIWNLVVGIGLPAKGVRTNTISRSCDFYGGEVTSQVSLQKDFQNREKCMHQSSVPEGRVNEMASCPEAERPLGFKFAREKVSQDVEAVAKVPECIVLQEAQEQGNISLNGKPQSSGNQLPLIVQVHEKQDKCLNPDKETGIPRDFVKEELEHEAPHGQIECTAKQLVESMVPTCEIENTPVESVEAAMTRNRFEEKESTKVPIQDKTMEESQDTKDFVEAKAEANKPLGLENARTDEGSNEKLEVSSVRSPEISDCCRKSRMAEHSHSSFSRKRKVKFNLEDDEETEHRSCASLNLEMSTKNLGKLCSLNGKGTECVSSTEGLDVEKSMVHKTAKQKGKRKKKGQKGKWKKKGRFLLPKYKRSTKPMEKVDIYEDTKDGNGARQLCNDEGLEAGSKRRQSMIRNRNLRDGQSGAVLFQPSSPQKTAEAKASITASVLEPIVNRRVETRQGVKEKAYVKKAAQKKVIAKKRRESLAKLQHTLQEARVYNDPSQMENEDPMLSTIDTPQVGVKIEDGLKVSNRRRKSEEADSEPNLCTQKPRRVKPSKKIETGNLEDSTCEKEASKGYCNKQAHTECNSSLSTTASPKKRLKQMLPPPLPLPLVSVSKQLISKAFGLKTSRSGRLLVPPLAHWRGQSLVRDMDGGIVAIEDGSVGAPKEDTGCFTFKPPMEARAKKLQKWLCETATECLTKKLKARKKASTHKHRFISS